MHISRAHLRGVKAVHTIGDRLKAWRESRRLTQPEAATCLGIPFRTYQNYEGGVRPPKADAFRAFISAGINANWLITGEGPMLLSNLSATDVAIPATPAYVAPKISVIALEESLSAMLATAKPGETTAASVHKAVQFYLFMDERGLVTPEGLSQGDMDMAS